MFHRRSLVDVRSSGRDQEEHQRQSPAEQRRRCGLRHSRTLLPPSHCVSGRNVRRVTLAPEGIHWYFSGSSRTAEPTALLQHLSPYL